MKNEILPYASSDHQLFSFGISMNESISSSSEVVPAGHIDSTVLNFYGRNSFSCIDSSLYNNNQYNFTIPPQVLLPMDYQSGLSSIMTSKRPDYHYDAAAAAAVGYRPPMYCNYDIDDDSSLVQLRPFPKKKLSVRPLLHFNDIQAIRNPRKRPLEVMDHKEAGSMKITGSNYKVVVNQWKTKKKMIHYPEQKPRQDKIQETVLEIPREKLPAVRRSQKLSDKITALQKLVSPYGKTDTASVLEEAYVSIKLLQDQIQNLFNKLISSSSSSVDHTEPLQYRKMTEERQPDLRKRGMCLVPVSFTQRLRILQETALNQRRLVSSPEIFDT